MMRRFDTGLAVFLFIVTPRAAFSQATAGESGQTATAPQFGLADVHPNPTSLPARGDNKSCAAAMDKQIGIKMITAKRAVPVLVIDHIEQKPTGN